MREWHHQEYGYNPTDLKQHLGIRIFGQGYQKEQKMGGLAANIAHQYVRLNTNSEYTLCPYTCKQVHSSMPIY
jgi:hypothetical protein